jgi:hypothetical protein
MTNTIAFYENVRRKASGGKKKKAGSVRAMLEAEARGKKRCGYGCFGLSFLCCCCTTSCGKSAFVVAEEGEMWLRALACYAGMTPEHINIMFGAALTLLHRLGERCAELLRAAHDEVAATLGLQDSDAYHKKKMDHARLRNDLGGEEWFGTLITNIYHHACFGRPLQYMDITDKEHNLLFVALPLFYPAIRSTIRHGKLPLDERVAHTIVGMVKDASLYL